jgi:glycosyltransferase involved in cell wall biosynthesis
LNLVFAGRVTETKGVFVLLEALARATSRVKTVRLTTYGHIDTPERYDTAKRSLGVRDLVEDRGFDERWREHLRPGQVFVLPSFYEGMPVAILEAMAAGLPIVATPVGGIPDVVRPNQTGFLVPVGDPVRLSEVLIWLAEHPEDARTMGREARRLVEAQYSDRAMANAYGRLYSALTGRPR